MRKAQHPSDQRRAQWLKGVLDLCVLGALRTGEAYGYELAKALEDSGLGQIKGGTLYPVLSRLEADRLVATTWRSSDQGPDRKYYRLTATGTALLEEARIEWTAFTTSTLRLMAAGITEATR